MLPELSTSPPVFGGASLIVVLAGVVNYHCSRDE
jgi:hypothetical protein